MFNYFILEKSQQLFKFPSSKIDSVAISSVSTDTVGPTRGLGNDRIPLQPNNRGQTFQVFSDENQGAGEALPPQSGEWASIPSRSVSNRENEKQPGKWTGAKVTFKFA